MFVNKVQKEIKDLGKQTSDADSTEEIDVEEGQPLNEVPDMKDPVGRLRRIIEHFRDTRTGVDCSEAKSVW
jgi:hypothetical protein